MTSTDTQTRQSTTRQRVQVAVSKDRLTAVMTIRKPRSDEPQVTVREIKQALESVGVVYGMKDNVIEQAAIDGVFDRPLKVAEGDPPRNGSNASFEHCFNVNFDRSPRVDKDGRIDYRDINVIQSVAKDDVLVRKSPATVGVAGTGVDGRPIPAVPGKEQPFNPGANTRVSSDGLELRATASGVILYRHGTVSVNDALVIEGDVDYSVGNIRSTSSVHVKGNVQPGFELHVNGDLQVGGNVQDCTIICKGNILIKGGCFGKGEGGIHADGDVMLKYAEGMRISACGNVVVGGELFNCRVIAGDQVTVKGGKGKIIGGDIKARRQIKASVIGSPAGTPTHVTVAYDADLLREHQTVVREIERLSADFERAEEGLSELYKQQSQRPLRSKKQAVLKELETFRRTVPQAIADLKEKKATLEERLTGFRDAVIIAEDTMHPGVVAHYGIVYRQITEPTSRCKLTLEGNQIIFSDYRPSDATSSE
ncbi:MAG: FapA family protein [Candidatus Zixiibacteriota bacterium]